MPTDLSRRRLLTLGAGGLATALLAGCGQAGTPPTFRQLLASANGLTLRAQRLLLSDQKLAREFPASMISPRFKANGTTAPEEADYRVFAAAGFAAWRLQVGGMVERPLSLSLADLRSLAARSQITRHDCVEGWSCIGQWSGPQLATVLDLAGVAPDARYVVFRCFDHYGGGTRPADLYYESIDLVDAFHPQTILATEMNGAPLTVPHGAPVRLRVERQLGYKMAKYLKRIELVASLDGIGGGHGGYWPDRGYDWYAGI